MKVFLEKIKLELKVNWKLSRNESLFKENYILKLEDKKFVSFGEIAPNIRYEETKELIENNFLTLKQRLKTQTLTCIINCNNFCNSFSFALSSAYTHLEAKKKNLETWKFLELQHPIKVKTSFSVPIMEEGLLRDYLKSLKRFYYIKIKVNQENAIRFVSVVSKLTKSALRIDANEGFDSLEKYLEFEKSLDGLNIDFIEQPFKAKDVELYKRLKPISKYPIIADESVEDDMDIETIKECFDGINVKLMKARSYENAIRLLRLARENGLKTMIGCMIETSLGISCGLNLASLCDYFDLDGSLLIKNDPYDLIEEKNGFLSIAKNYF
ncbi:MAG: hypothetical protein N4A33_00590 [Bacteriovoracaceae bacterium]|nr:hypothetical protein [Bacteriovoracaceae bacterium]